MSIKKFVCVLTFLFVFLSLNINAYDYSYIEDKFNAEDIMSTLPEDIKSNIPDGMFDGDDIYSVSSNADTNKFLMFILNILKNSLKPFTQTFSSLLIIIISSSVLNGFKNSAACDGLSKVITYVTLLVLAIVTYGILKDLWNYIKDFMEVMNSIMSTLLPVMTLIYTAGGNVSTSVVNSTGIAVMLTIMNVICQNGLLPILKVCFGLTFAGSIGSLKGMESIVKNLKSLFSFVLSGMVTILSIILLFRTNIATASDGVAVRSVKFAGSFIPVVGGALGESVRSIMSGLNLIKNSVGYIGIVIILFITLPVVIKILLNKFCISAASSISELLGCEKEGKLLKEFSSVLDLALAVTVTVSVMFIFELTVFVSTGLALGGG